MKNLIIKKPWGMEYTVFKKGISVRILHINKGQETSFHCHMKKDVLMVLLSGRAIMKRNGTIVDYLEDIELQPMFVRQIAKGVYHKTKALEDTVIMEIESLDDIHDLVRAEDKYSRGQGYEVKDIVSIDDIIEAL